MPKKEKKRKERAKVPNVARKPKVQIKKPTY